MHKGLITRKVHQRRLSGLQGWYDDPNTRGNWKRTL